jgi:hypothetical protein
MITNVPCLNIKYPLFFSYLIKLEFYLQIFEKYSGIKLYENLSNESRVILCEQTGGGKNRQKWRNSLLLFIIFSKAPKNEI